MDWFAHSPTAAPAAAAMLADDNRFGPQYGQQFDFTMVFSNIVLTIVPAALIIAASPAYIFAGFGKPPMTAKKGPLLRKLVRFA